MGRIRVETTIAAPIERVFDVARDIDIHVASQIASREEAVAGRTGGLIGLGETVTFRARHFGVTMELTSRVASFEPPTRFVDEQVRGPFASFRHEHVFRSTGPRTMMIDDWTHRSPLGWLGRIVDAIALDRYLRRQLVARGQVIRTQAERGAAAAARHPDHGD
jgi:ligand-binding SRPBCC domain-containing protein